MTNHSARNHSFHYIYSLICIINETLNSHELMLSTYLHCTMNDDPNNTHDCHEQIISVSSGLPIATWCKSNIFHDYFHEEDQCQNRGHRSECFRVFSLDSPLRKNEKKINMLLTQKRVGLLLPRSNGSRQGTNDSK